MKVVLAQANEVINQPWSVVLGAALWLKIRTCAETFLLSQIVLTVTSLGLLNMVLGILIAVHASLDAESKPEDRFAWSKATQGISKWVAWMVALCLTYGFRVHFIATPLGSAISLAMDAVDGAIALTITGSVVKHISRIVKTSWMTRTANLADQAPDRVIDSALEKLEDIIGQKKEEKNV